MLIDSLVSFLPPGISQSMVGGAGVAIQIGNIIDLLGSGVGTAPANIIGNATVFGTDMGIGAIKPQVQVNIGTAFTTANGATLDVAFQAAIDTGVAGGYQPGTWDTLVETGAIAVGSLTLNAIIARFDYPPAFPPGLQPRFIRLLGIVPAATNFTAGVISAAPLTMVRDDLSNAYAASNFKVA